MVEVTIDSMRHGANRWTLILKEKAADRYLPISIGQAQADVIKGELVGPKSTAPDDFLASIKASDARVEAALIDRLENSVFHARVLLHDKSFDCPVFMAVALAARGDAPILVEEMVMGKSALTVNWDWPWGAADAVIRAAESSRRQ